MSEIKQILLYMPSWDSQTRTHREDLQRKILDRFGDWGLLEKIGIGIQATPPFARRRNINDVPDGDTIPRVYPEDFPIDQLDKLVRLPIYERVSETIARHPDYYHDYGVKTTSVMHNYEPRLTDDNGNDVSYMPGPHTNFGYTKHEVEFYRAFQRGLEEATKKVGLEHTMYNYHRLPGSPRDADNNSWYDDRDMENALQISSVTSKLSFIEQNVYPRGRAHLDEITRDNVMLIRDRVENGYRIHSSSVSGEVEIVPTFYPRWNVNNALYHGTYLEMFRRFTPVTRIELWTNPHNDGMTRVYMNSIDEMADSLRAACGMSRLGKIPQKRDWQSPR